MTDESVEVSLVRSIASERLADLGGDIAELVLDATLDQGVLRDIPVFGSLLKVLGVFRSVRDRLFAKKVYRFLREFHDVPQEEREAFVNKEMQNPAHALRVGETLIEVLEHLDDGEKAKYVARVFRRYLEGALRPEVMRRYLSVLDRGYLPDLLEYVERGDSGSRLGPVLATLGLVDQRSDALQVLRQQQRDVPRRDVKLVEYITNPLGQGFRAAMGWPDRLR